MQLSTTLGIINLKLIRRYTLMSGIDRDFVEGLLIGVLTGVLSAIIRDWYMKRFIVKVKEGKRILSFNFNYDLNRLKYEFRVRVSTVYVCSVLIYLYIMILCDKINITGLGPAFGLIIGIIFLFFWDRLTHCILFDEMNSRYEGINDDLCNVLAHSVRGYKITSLVCEFLILVGVFLCYTVNTNGIIPVNFYIIIIAILITVILMAFIPIRMHYKYEQRQGVYIVNNLEYQEFKIHLKNGVVHSLKINEEVVADRHKGLIIKGPEEVKYYKREDIKEIIDYNGDVVKF